MSELSLPYARFPRLERQGWMWGLTGGQILVVAAAVALLMRAVLGSVSGDDFGVIVQTLFFVSLPLAAFGVISIRRRALTTMTWEWVVWVLRNLLGQTEFKIRPETPTSRMTFGLPGAVGARISVHRTAFAEGSAMLWDARERTATVILQCKGSSFPLASDEDRAGRAGAFAQLCSQVVKHEGVVRVATYARTIPAASAALSDYYDTTSVSRGAGAYASPWADAQYRELLTSPQVGSAAVVSRDVLLTVTVSAAEARAAIRAAGGGKRGMSVVLTREVLAISGLLSGTGIDSVKWLDVEGVAEAVRMAFDPASVDALETRRVHTPSGIGGTGPVEQGSAGPTYIKEHADHVETDSALHRTYWIAEWPRTEVEVGFLEPLICTGTYPHTLTQVFTPVPVHTALKDIAKARQGIEAQMTANMKLTRPITAEMHATLADVDEREREVTAGFGAVRFTGYVTVSGADQEELAAASSNAQMACANLDLRLLKRQQAAAFTAAMLPLGWGLK